MMKSSAPAESSSMSGQSAFDSDEFQRVILFFPLSASGFADHGATRFALPGRAGVGGGQRAKSKMVMPPPLGPDLTRTPSSRSHAGCWLCGLLSALVYGILSRESHTRYRTAFHEASAGARRRGARWVRQRLSSSVWRQLRAARPGHP